MDAETKEYLEKLEKELRKNGKNKILIIYYIIMAILSFIITTLLIFK